MKKKKKAEVINCEFFSWRLRLRDGVYYADGRAGKYNRGKHSLNTRDRDEAERVLRLLDRKKAVEFGLISELEIPSQLTVSIADGWLRYFEHCKRPLSMGGTGQGTRDRYDPIRNRFVRFCAEKKVSGWDRVDRNCLESYARWLKTIPWRGKRKVEAERTFRLELQVNMAVLNWLIDTKQLAESCRVRMKLKRPEGSDRYCYTREEVAAMIAHCEADASRHWLHVLIVALACTGLRIRELLGLRWSDFDLDSNVISLADERAHSKKQRMGTGRRIKGKRSRYLPIHCELCMVLANLPRHKDNRVFRGLHGEPLEYYAALDGFIANVITPLSEKFPTPDGEIGFSDARFHSFRHFFVSEALRAGATEGDLRDWLGNRSSELIEHYRHLRANDSQRRMQSINFFDNPRANA